MRFLTLFIFFKFISSGLFCLEDQFEPFVENGKVGLKNTSTNTIAIPATFQSIGWSDQSFQIVNGTLGAMQNEKWALINLDGHKVTDHLFSDLKPTKTGNLLASKRLENSILISFGLIDSRGKTLVPFEFSGLRAFENRLIATKKIGSRYSVGLITEKGDDLIPFEFSSMNPLIEDHIAVKDFNELIAIYNAHGQKLTDFQFEAIIPISDQLYLISKYNHQGLLNKQLQMIVPPLYKSLNLSSDQAQALAYDQWDYYSENTYSATYYYDEVGFTDEPTFVTLSDSKTGIINLQDEHLLFLPNESYHDGNEEIFVTQNKSSGRFRVYSSHGRNLFRDSFDEVVLFEEIFFAKTNQPDEHAWSVYNFSGKKLNLSNYQSFNRRSPLFFEVKQNDKLGLIGSNGQEVSPFLYDELSQFSNGRAIALYNEGYGVINENGIWIMTPYHDSLTILDEAIYFKQGSEYGVADLFGKVKYRSQEHFEMYSNVIIRTEEDSTLALYNLEDERLLEPSYQSIRKLNDDLLLLHRDKKSFIYRLSDRADFKLDPAVIEIGNLVNGFIPIRKDDQWGFLNVEGRLVIANRYEAVQDFSEGYFPVKLIGKWGFVNDNEELVIQPNFDSVEPFKNSLSIVKSNGKYGLINPKGSFELEMNFDGIERYGKYFLIELNGLIGLADANGKILKNPSYDAIQLLDQNYFLVKRNGNFGVIDLDGNDIMPTNYIEIKQSGTRFLGKKPGEHRTFKIQ